MGAGYRLDRVTESGNRMQDFTSIAPGQEVSLQTGLSCVLAPNPSPMTGPGTNTYLLGTQSLAVIDPGPADDSHLEALLRVIRDRPVSHIIVTHSHLDHSPLAASLAQQVGAPVLAFGDSFAGRSEVMSRLATEGMTGGGEGLDVDFRPDQPVRDGDKINGDGWSLNVLHTPGHLANHISLQWQDVVFVGDVVMGWSTSLVSPPDGDMADFLTSCARLKDLGARVLYSGHGAPIADPAARLTEVIAHREARNDAILAALSDGPSDVPALVRQIYVGLMPGLEKAAGRNVFAHLIALTEAGKVRATPVLREDARFTLAGP